MKTLQTKKLNQQTAIEIVNVVVTSLALAGVDASLIMRGKKFTFTAVKDADKVCMLFSNFEIDFKNGQKFAEFVINYE
jgi:hypothetical protein